VEALVGHAHEDLPALPLDDSLERDGDQLPRPANQGTAAGLGAGQGELLEEEESIEADSVESTGN